MHRKILHRCQRAREHANLSPDLRSMQGSAFSLLGVYHTANCASFQGLYQCVMQFRRVSGKVVSQQRYYRIIGKCQPAGQACAIPLFSCNGCPEIQLCLTLGMTTRQTEISPRKEAQVMVVVQARRTDIWTAEPCTICTSAVKVRICMLCGPSASVEIVPLYELHGFWEHVISLVSRCAIMLCHFAWDAGVILHRIVIIILSILSSLRVMAYLDKALFARCKHPIWEIIYSCILLPFLFWGSLD